MKFRTDFTNTELEVIKWFEFYPEQWFFEFTIRKSGYFDSRPRISTTLTTLIFFAGLFSTGFSLLSIVWIPLLFISWGKIFIMLPFDSGIWNADSEFSYGFYFYDVDPKPNTLFIPNEIIWNWGLIYKTFSLPYNLVWYRSSILLENDKWEHEYRGNRKNFYHEYWKSMQKVWEFNYIDPYDDEVIPTKVYLEEREWRRYCLPFTSFFAKKRTYIDIHFSKQAGKKKGSWKGGALNTGHPLSKGQTVEECFKEFSKKILYYAQFRTNTLRCR